jgi:hypothetical protein
MLNYNILYSHNTLFDANKCNSETKIISLQVLEELEKQGQTLVHTNKNINESNELLNKSNEILKLMSWSGWFASFIPFKGYFDKWFTTSKFDKINSTGNLNIQNHIKNNNLLEKCNSHKNDNKITSGNLSTTINYSTLTSLENEELNKLERELTDLSYIGKQIGHHLDLHNNYIDTINEKIKILSNTTQKTHKKTTYFL